MTYFPGENEYFIVHDVKIEVNEKNFFDDFKYVKCRLNLEFCYAGKYPEEAKVLFNILLNEGNDRRGTISPFKRPRIIYTKLVDRC